MIFNSGTLVLRVVSFDRLVEWDLKLLNDINILIEIEKS